MTDCKIMIGIKTSECGEYCGEECPYFCQREPDMVQSCAVETHDERDVRPLKYYLVGWLRSDACLAAEIEVDEMAIEISNDIISEESAWFDDEEGYVVKLARAYLALAEKLKGGER